MFVPALPSQRQEFYANLAPSAMRTLVVILPLIMHTFVDICALSDAISVDYLYTKLHTNVVMNWKEKLGEDIQKARDQFPGGMSQEQLAALVKFSRTTIGNYESGKRAPNFEQLLKMAKVLGRQHFDAGPMRIEFGSNGRPHPEPVPQQLELRFDDKKGVSIRIEPVGQGLIIKKLSA